MVYWFLAWLDHNEPWGGGVDPIYSHESHAMLLQWHRNHLESVYVCVCVGGGASGAGSQIYRV